MSLISCIKQVRDLDIVLKDDWVVGEDGRSINIGYANRIMNTFDETSLELMLRLSDEDDDLQTRVVTIGSPQSETILRKALALGVAEAVRVDQAEELDFNPGKTASILRDVIQADSDVELVFCGRQADNGSNGQTGQMLAEMLGWPCITMVTDIKKTGDEYKVSRLVEQGLEHLYLKGPMVISVTQSENKLLRMAGLKSMLDAKKKPISRLRVEAAGRFDNGSLYKLGKISINKPEKHCLFIEDKKDESKADQLKKILRRKAPHEQS